MITLYYWYIGSTRGVELGEAKPVDALKLFVNVGIIAGAIHLFLLVAVPGAIATGVEVTLGLTIGARITNPFIALIPGVIASIYYIILVFIAYNVLKPYNAVKIQAP